MNRLERMKSILTQEFQPCQIELHDDSHKHIGHAGASPLGETHYSLRIESAKFAGMSKVRRHQAVYALLKEEFANGLHALAIETRAPGEA